MNDRAPSPPFNPWPWALIAFFVCFIGLVIAFIVFAVGQDLQLVREDYYEEEIRYQEQIDRLNRTWLVREQVRVAYDAAGQTIDILLPSSHAEENATGRIHFYRPSDASLDHEVALRLGADGRQVVPVSELAGGLWNLHLFWEANGQEYYAKHVVVIARGKS